MKKKLRIKHWSIIHNTSTLASRHSANTKSNLHFSGFEWRNSSLRRCKSWSSAQSCRMQNPTKLLGSVQSCIFSFSLIFDIILKSFLLISIDGTTWCELFLQQWRQHKVQQQKSNQFLKPHLPSIILTFGSFFLLKV